MWMLRRPGRRRAGSIRALLSVVATTTTGGLPSAAPPPGVVLAVMPSISISRHDSSRSIVRSAER